MKKICLLLILTVIFSCDNSGSQNSYYIKAKFNGELKEFNYDVVGTYGYDNNNTQNIVHIVLGADQDPGQGAAFAFPAYDIELWNLDRNITLGNYSEEVYDIQSRYALDGYTRFNNFYNDTDDYIISIKSISSTEISGTFSGTITNSNNEDIIITSGEFYVPIKN